VARRPWISGNFLAAIAGHDLGKCIEAFQRMRLRRKYPPVEVRSMGFRFHNRTLFLFQGIRAQGEPSLGNNVQKIPQICVP
jgi:CRISPR/Cas system-associated endonuclease Cas3-HD